MVFEEFFHALVSAFHFAFLLAPHARLSVEDALQALSAWPAIYTTAERISCSLAVRLLFALGCHRL